VNAAEEYGCRSGNILGGSGYPLVKVSDAATVQFIKANNQQEVVSSYDIE
jgi:hypothetical protein